MHNSVMRYQEQMIETTDGTSLFVRSWRLAGSAPRRWIVMTHGLGEHTARHQFSAEFFAGRGFGVVAYDMRGHGRSSGRRGHVWRYTSLLDDLALVRQSMTPSGAQVFSFGHSFGGQVTLNYELSGRGGFTGYVATAPWLALAIKPPLVKVLAGKVARWLCPVLSFPLGLRRDQLAVAPQQELSAEEEALMHRRVTAWMFAKITKAASRAGRNATQMRAPLMVVHGCDDPVTDVEASRRFYRQAGSTDKLLKLYADGRHELHNEANREEFLAEVVEWIDGRSEG